MTYVGHAMGHKRRAALVAKFSADTEGPVVAESAVTDVKRCRECGRDDMGFTLGGLVERHRPRVLGPDGPYIKAVPCLGGLQRPEVVAG